MDYVVKGRTSFNKQALKGADLETMIETYKRIESAENVQAAWEEVNGKYTPKKVEVENPKKKSFSKKED